MEQLCHLVTYCFPKTICCVVLLFVMFSKLFAMHFYVRAFLEAQEDNTLASDSLNGKMWRRFLNSG